MARVNELTTCHNHHTPDKLTENPPFTVNDIHDGQTNNRTRKARTSSEREREEEEEQTSKP